MISAGVHVFASDISKFPKISGTSREVSSDICGVFKISSDRYLSQIPRRSHATFCLYYKEYTAMENVKLTGVSNLPVILPVSVSHISEISETVA